MPEQKTQFRRPSG